MPVRSNFEGRFRDRRDAGRQLAAALRRYRGRHAVVLGLPRGGVPVAAEMARSLRASLDLVVARKIGVPGYSELAMGAVVDAVPPVVVRNEEVIATRGVTSADFGQALERELMEARLRRERYLNGREPIEIGGRTAIVVDDGIATGSTMRAAVLAVRGRGPSHLVLAVPVGPRDVIDNLRGNVDELICLRVADDFGAVGFHYDDFAQVSDEDVAAILAEFRPVDEGRPNT